MNLRTKILAATVATVAITGGIGATWATAETPSPSPSATTSTSPSPQSDPTKAEQNNRAGQNKSGQTKAEKKHRLLQQRALHGEATLGGKNHRVVVFQRGTVEKVSATSVTVKSKDGYTASYQVSSTTKVRQDKEAATISAVKVDDKVRVVGTKDGAAVAAKTIVDRAK